MRAEPNLRRGWCPGALTPMLTGDGWLVRVRPRNGGFSMSQLTALAQAATSCGNGEIDLTNRANLQLRGLSPASVLRAQEILSAAGLIDEDAATEAIRNVLVAPTAGIDPAACDVRPLAHALECALIADDGLQGLPHKFGFAVDGGGGFCLPAGIADITLRAHGGETQIVLAGNCQIAARVCDGDAVAAALGLARHYVATARTNPLIRRIRDLVGQSGAAAVFQAAGLDAHLVPRADTPPAHLPIGLLGSQDALWALGVGLPYGRMSADALLQLVAAARACGVTHVRPSPSRVLVLPMAGLRATEIRAAASALGLITQADDPRLMMDACPGAPGCERGSTPTRDDADRIAALFRHWGGAVRSVHVSGCPKGCAHRGAADLTLVARNGLYDVVCRGTVSDIAIASGVSSERLAGVLSAVAGVTHV